MVVRAGRRTLRRRQLSVDSTVTVTRASRGGAAASAVLMSNRPVEVSLEVNPATRLDVIDVGQTVKDQHGDALSPFPRALYLFVPHDRRLPRSKPGHPPPTARRAGRRAVREGLPDHLPRGGRLRARQAREAERALGGAEAERAAERRLAPGVHRRRAPQLRHLPQSPQRAGLLRRPRRRQRRPGAPPPDDHRRLQPRGRGRPRAARDPGLRPPDRFGQPEGPEARALRADRGADGEVRAWPRAASASSWRRASATPASPSTSTRRS